MSIEELPDVKEGDWILIDESYFLIKQVDRKEKFIIISKDINKIIPCKGALRVLYYLDGKWNEPKALKNIDIEIKADKPFHHTHICDNLWNIRLSDYL